MLFPSFIFSIIVKNATNVKIQGYEQIMKN